VTDRDKLAEALEWADTSLALDEVDGLTGDYYILDRHNAVRCDAMTWASWFETHQKDRRVAATEITPDVHVSTVFLGLDHALGIGPPQIFETMIFGGVHNGDQWRYSTWDEAIAGHEAAVALAAQDKGGEG
jgi:hypothetical protein